MASDRKYELDRQYLAARRQLDTVLRGMAASGYVRPRWFVKHAILDKNVLTNTLDEDELLSVLKLPGMPGTAIVHSVTICAEITVQHESGEMTTAPYVIELERVAKQ